MINVHVGFNRPIGDLKMTQVTHTGNIRIIKDMLGNICLTFRDTKPWGEVRYPLSAITNLIVEPVEVGS